MSPALALSLYVILALSLTVLRLNQGWRPGDALFNGLFWPADLGRRGIDLLMAGLLDLAGQEGRS
ncbi:MAG: hypothetical protein AB1899_15250 [Pseudomonadota bacterium]